MGEQHLLSNGPLLDHNGDLAEAGYAHTLVKGYDRAAIKAPKWRIKEWDYYYVGNKDNGLALTVADNGYMSMDSISLLDFDRNEQHTYSRMRFFPRRRGLPLTSAQGDIHAQGKDYEIAFLNDGKRRQLYGHMDNFGKVNQLNVRLRLDKNNNISLFVNGTPSLGSAPQGIDLTSNITKQSIWPVTF